MKSRFEMTRPLAVSLWLVACGVGPVQKIPVAGQNPRRVGNPSGTPGGIF